MVTKDYVNMVGSLTQRKICALFRNEVTEIRLDVKIFQMCVNAKGLNEIYDKLLKL